MAEEATCNVGVSFTVVWLDQGIESSRGSRNTKAMLSHKVGGHLKTFDDADNCVDYITSAHGKRIFLITSGAFGSKVVPLIYQVVQVQGIYVFCINRKLAEEWAKPDCKVIGIFTDTNSLLARIDDDLRACDRDSHLPISVFHLQERQSLVRDLTKESATFMWHQLLLVVIRSLGKWNSSKDEMVRECYLHYQKDAAEKVKIERFEKEYAPLKAIWWYTWDCFVYRLLNKALRTQNIETIFKFRFFICDLHYHIESLYHMYLNSHRPISAHQLRLYRGQNLHIDELELLRKNIDGLISMNTFLSATTDEQLAILFAELDPNSEDSASMRSVMFTIDIRHMSKETTPFARIKSFSCYQEEDEVLFTIGAVFKVLDVRQVGEIWHVHLQLSKEENQLNQDLSNDLLRKIGGRATPLALGWFLFRMNEFSKAERFALSLLDQLPEKDGERGHTYNLLGLIYKDMGRLQQAVDAYKEALKTFSHNPSANLDQVIVTHYNLGLAYLALNNKELATEQHTEAETKLINSATPMNPALTSMTDSLRAKIRAAGGDYPSALTGLQQVLVDKQKNLPARHPSIGTTWKDIGTVQMKMDLGREALSSFQEVLKIYRASLPSDHVDLVDCYTKIGDVHYEQQEYALALKEFENALNIVQNATRDADTIQDLQERITKTKQRMARSTSH